MKKYDLKNESYITLENEAKVSGRNIYMLTVPNKNVVYVTYCHVSGMINNGVVNIINSNIDSILGNGTIYSRHSNISSVAASFAWISSSYVRGINKDCRIEGSLSEFHWSRLDNPESEYEDCIFSSCEINAGTFKNCVFADGCKISENAVIE